MLVRRLTFTCRLISICLLLLSRPILGVGIAQKLKKLVMLVVAFVMAVLVLKLLLGVRERKMAGFAR